MRERRRKVEDCLGDSFIDGALSKHTSKVGSTVSWLKQFA